MLCLTDNQLDKLKTFNFWMCFLHGIGHSDGASYLEIVEFLAKSNADVEATLHELWRRNAGLWLGGNRRQDELRHQLMDFRPSGVLMHLVLNPFKRSELATFSFRCELSSGIVVVDLIRF